MDFDYTEEQTALQDSLRRFASSGYGFTRRNELLRKRRWCREAWKVYADIGLLALPFPVEAGGLGGSSYDVMAAMEVLGESLMLEPFVPTVLLAGTVLSTATSQQHMELVERIAAGAATYALAHQEPHRRHAIKPVDTHAVRVPGGWRLDGRKAVVLGAPDAEGVIVSARLSDDIDGDVGLFLVDRATAGLRLHSYRLHDGQLAADVWLEGVVVADSAQIQTNAPSMAVVQSALDRGVVALCSGAVGSMQALLHQTVSYLQQRKQFGQPLGQFQALRHRVADMAVQVEQARSMALLAASHAGSTNPALCTRMASAAKALISELAREVGQTAVQLHGGMGLTEELIVGHHFRYLSVFESMLGDAGFHLTQFVESPAREEWQHAA
jgi:alkylation response protein AidB-like acyl-CoA dehydrogenase